MFSISEYPNSGISVFKMYILRFAFNPFMGWPPKFAANDNSVAERERDGIVVCKLGLGLTPRNPRSEFYALFNTRARDTLNSRTGRVRVSYKVAPGGKGLKEFHALLEKTRDKGKKDKLMILKTTHFSRKS